MCIWKYRSYTSWITLDWQKKWLKKHFSHQNSIFHILNYLGLAEKMTQNNLFSLKYYISYLELSWIGRKSDSKQFYLIKIFYMLSGTTLVWQKNGLETISFDLCTLFACRKSTTLSSTCTWRCRTCSAGWRWSSTRWSCPCASPAPWSSLSRTRTSRSTWGRCRTSPSRASSSRSRRSTRR